MTQIDFYFHVENKLQTACALSAKAFSRGLRVLAFCPDPESGQKFSRLLWTTPAIGFIPHCAPDDRLAAVTPVIVDHDGSNLLHDQVLLNLRAEWPPFFSRFQRLIEIVSLDEEDRRLARERYKFYRDRGYEIQNHDMSKAAQ
ncbi:MAG: DNA polymerase III subunit chi [Betaproteobacteria bacterium]|nr:DNA polymerase III subunit chi [Betaproteobacteria bacterium]